LIDNQQKEEKRDPLILLYTITVGLPEFITIANKFSIILTYNIFT